MKNHIIILLLFIIFSSCKKDVPKKSNPITPEISKEKIQEIDSTAILDSIAVRDSIMIQDSIAQLKLIKKKAAARVKTKKKEKKKTEIVNKNDSPYKTLIFNVQIGINPKQKNWVLFKNGTYVIFPDGYTKDQMKNAAIKLVNSYKNNPLTANKSSFAKGWNISTSIGVYNYVSKNQLKKGATDNKAVKAKGRANILKDKSQAQVIHINTKEN